jgi:uncharacterized protein YjbI with pentapeptide repeats
MDLTRRQKIFLGIALIIAVACSIYTILSPGFAVTPVLGTTMIAIALTGSLAYILFTHPSDRARDVGAALVSGAVFLLAAAMTQAASDVNTFRNSVAFEPDLHGFDPEGRSLRGFNFGGKNLRVANFSDADLRKARLREADLSTADLSGADLSGADLYYAQLHEADVHNADFSRADLRGAKFGTRLPENLDSAVLTGAKVSDDTCWRIPRSRAKTALPNITPTQRGWETIDHLTTAGMIPLDPGRALGHVCTADERELESQHPPSVRIYLCPEAPFLREEDRMLSVEGKSELFCSPP